MPFEPGADAAPVSPGDAVASSDNIAEGPPPPFYRRLIRRILHRWFWLSRGITMGVRAIVIDANGHVFLVRHSYMPGWHLPGGGIERGQNARQALETELREEGNLFLTAEPRMFGIYHSAPAAPRDHVLLYVVRSFEQSGRREADREIVETGFFPPDALPAGTTSGTRRRIHEVLNDLPPRHRW